MGAGFPSSLRNRRNHGPKVTSWNQHLDALHRDELTEGSNRNVGNQQHRGVARLILTADFGPHDSRGPTDTSFVIDERGAWLLCSGAVVSISDGADAPIREGAGPAEVVRLS